MLCHIPAFYTRFYFMKGAYLYMSKETVISIRNALKAGKNLPLKVYADNDFIIVVSFGF